MNFTEIQQLEDRLQVETYKKMPIAIERGEGAWVWTSDGEKYLDLYGGHAVCATGHSHPHVVEAIKEQVDKVLFYSNLVYSEIRAKAAEKLVSVAPESLTKAFRAAAVQNSENLLGAASRTDVVAIIGFIVEAIFVGFNLYHAGTQRDLKPD